MLANTYTSYEFLAHTEFMVGQGLSRFHDDVSSISWMYRALR